MTDFLHPLGYRTASGTASPKRRDNAPARDNAVTETLFGSLKVARLHEMRFATCRQAKEEVIDWLQFYNHRRLHSTLRYLSTMAFEKKRLADKERLAA
jgi:transposase InsO family protein